MKVKIDNLFLAVELKWTGDKSYTDYGELKMMDSKNRKEFDMYKLYYKNLEKFPFLKNDTFMLVDKSLLKEYLEWRKKDLRELSALEIKQCLEYMERNGGKKKEW